MTPPKALLVLYVVLLGLVIWLAHLVEADIPLALR